MAYSFFFKEHPNSFYYKYLLFMNQYRAAKVLKYLFISELVIIFIAKFIALNLEAAYNLFPNREEIFHFHYF